MPIQRTLVLLKPDAVQRCLTGEILSRFERKGLIAVGAGTNIAESAGAVPAVALAGMVILFGFWVTLVSRQQRVRHYN